MDGMVAMNSTDVSDAGGMQQANQQVQATAGTDIPGEQTDGSDEGEDDSSDGHTVIMSDGSDDDHADSSPQLGERQGMCEHHARHGSHYDSTQIKTG